MALSLSTAFRNAIQSSERYGAVLFTFEFGDGTYGLWTAEGERVYNGITYRAGGSVLELSDIEGNADGSVAECTLTLSTDPDKGLTDDILVTFYDSDWHNRPVTIEVAMMDPDTRAIVGSQILFRGIMAAAPYKENADKSRIEALLSSKSIALSANGGQYRNDVTQKLLDATDNSLLGIGSLNGSISKDLKWGQA